MPTSMPALATFAVALGAGALAAVSLARALDRAPTVIALPAPPPPPPTEPGQPHGYTASGTATVEAVPDVAELVATLEVDRPRADEAARQVHTESDAVVKALLGAGLRRQDVALSQLHLEPVIETVDPKRGTTRVSGHHASITIVITTHDFDAVPNLLEVAAGAGATQVSSSFRVDDLPALKRKVRAMAAAAARQKADEIAGALGVKLGAVRAIIEQPGDGWGWNGTYANAVVREDPGTGAHGDLQSITMTVDVTYDLGRS